MSPLYAFLDTVRGGVKKLLARLAILLNKVTCGRISPNTVTIVGFLAHIPIALLVADGELILAAILLVFFGLFDALDGELARLQKSDGPKGMLLDSVTDRVKEVLLYTGIAYYFVNLNKEFYAVWAVAACGTAVVVSYINAWGEVVTADLPKEKHIKNGTFRVSLMTYDTRIFLLVIGLLLSQLPITVIVIALLSCLTAVERLANVYKRL